MLEPNTNTFIIQCHNVALAKRHEARKYSVDKRINYELHTTNVTSNVVLSLLKVKRMIDYFFSCWQLIEVDLLRMRLAQLPRVACEQGSTRDAKTLLDSLEFSTAIVIVEGVHFRLL